MFFVAVLCYLTQYAPTILRTVPVKALQGNQPTHMVYIKMFLIESTHWPSSIAVINTGHTEIQSNVLTRYLFISALFSVDNALNTRYSSVAVQMIR